MSSVKTILLLSLLVVALISCSIIYLAVQQYSVEGSKTPESPTSGDSSTKPPSSSGIGRVEFSYRSSMDNSFIEMNSRDYLKNMLYGALYLKSLFTSISRPYAPYGYGPAYYGPAYVYEIGTLKATVGETVATGTTAGVETPERLYSRTNVQVEGIDEIDIVKTDGEYIYVVKNVYEENFTGSRLYILKAYPPENLSIISRVSFEEFYTNGLYIYGDKIVVVGAKNVYRILGYPGSVKGVYGRGEASVIVYSDIPETYVIVLEFNGSSTSVVDTHVVDGWYVDSRLYNGVLYLVTSIELSIYGSEPYIPRINGVEVDTSKILIASNDYPETYSIIYCLSLDNMADNVTVFLHGSTSRIYMSFTSIYLIGYSSDYMVILKSIVDYIDNTSVREEIIEVLDSDKPVIEKAITVYRILEDYVESSGYGLVVYIDGEKTIIPFNDTRRKIVIERPFYYNPLVNTTIYRFSYKELELEYVGSIKLPGRLMDPFSINEFNGTLRVALHNNVHDDNSLYILNISSMEVIGNLTGIGKGMDIYAARYVGSRAYLVTYRRKDPLLVIDVSDPYKPVLLGKLVMPGYSDYLHPLNDTILLGIGMDEDGSLKIQTYNVSDPLNPSIISTISVRGAYTSVFGDYKAFTINTRDHYFIIPVMKYGGVNGFYVIEYGSSGKLELKGTIKVEDPLRSVFIEDTIYGIGYRLVVAVNAITLERINTIEIA